MKIFEGEKIPIGYGYAWTNWDSMNYTVYLVPFNIVLRWLRNLWFRLGRRVDSREEKAFIEGRKQGGRINELQNRDLKIEYAEKGIKIGWEMAFYGMANRKLPDEKFRKAMEKFKERLINKLK